MCKIGVIATYTELITVVRKTAAEIKQDIVVKLGSLEQGVELAKKMIIEHEVDAIVSRGPTGEMIKNNLELPVIVIEITNFDLIRAFHNAKLQGEKIVFIDFMQEKFNYDLDIVKEILNVNINRYLFNEIQEIKGLVREAWEYGADVVVGTAECIINEARHMGMKGILVNVGKEDIINAIERAKSTIDIRKREKEKAKWMETILDNTQEGTIVIDYLNRIRIFNKSAEKILGLSSKNIVGNKVNHIKENKFLKTIYSDGNEITGDIVDIRQDKIAVNRFHIHVDKEFYGVVITIQKISRLQELEGKIRKSLHSKGFVAKANFEDIICSSSKMKQLKRKAKQYGIADSTVLIIGNSGTGKELFAQSIHNVSERKKGPFVGISCASFPKNLLESELFGYEEGAFTGAKKGGKLGLFELAHNGTLFLDEIGEIPLSLQSRLLRVLQEKEVMRLGGDKIIPVNTRVICATNKNLLKKVKEGTFREDLYYRINILKLSIPPLKERREDIPLIGKRLLDKNAVVFNKKINIDESLFCLLASYDWPGNVRELENFIQRLIALSENDYIDKELFSNTLDDFLSENGYCSEINEEKAGQTQDETIIVKLGTLEEIENQIINIMDQKWDGDKNKISEVLGVSRTTLWRKYNQLNGENN